MGDLVVVLLAVLAVVVGLALIHTLASLDIPPLRYRRGVSLPALEADRLESLGRVELQMHRVQVLARRRSWWSSPSGRDRRAGDCPVDPPQ